MRSSDIERWALNVIRRIETHQPVEDSRVELKTAWPTDHWKAARRIQARPHIQEAVNQLQDFLGIPRTTALTMP